MNTPACRHMPLPLLLVLLATMGCHDPYGLRFEVADWDFYKSAHVGFYEQRGSARSADDIQGDLDVLEQQYSRLSVLLHLTPKNEIRCYRYWSKGEMSRILGWSSTRSGCAIHFKGVSEIHFAGAQSTLRHELAHVFANQLRDCSAAGLLEEGFAVCYEEAGENTGVHLSCKNRLQSGELKPLITILTTYSIRGDASGYRQAGSFVKYLIDTYEIERFKELYRRTSTSELQTDQHIFVTSREVYAKSFADLEAEWRSFLASWSDD